MRFPLELRFNLIAFAPQLSVRDATGQLVLYVKQKAFKLKESVTVFADEQQTRPLYRIEADRIIDFSARYAITDLASSSGGGGREVGAVQRRGMRSIWRAHYEIQRDGVTALEVREENPWIKVLDGVVGDVPILGLLAGYVFNPSYRVSPVGSEQALLRMRKRPALFEGRFELERPVGGGLGEDDERLALLALLMIILLERQRG